MKKLFNFFAIFLTLVFASCTQAILEDSPSETKTAVKSTVDVINPILGEVTGTSTLHRTNNGITVNYKTTGLTPGYAYTLWIVIWNNPENCATPNQCNDLDFALANLVEVDVLYGNGNVVGDDGVGNFSARLNEGDDSESINALFGLPPAGGLQSGNSFGAEVHFVLRSHGPKIPGQVSEQIGGYLGGCTDPFAIPPFTEIPDSVGECGDIEFAIHAPVN